MSTYGRSCCSGGLITAAGLLVFRRIANDYQYLLLKTAHKSDCYWTPPKGRSIVNLSDLETAEIAIKKLTGYTSCDYNVFVQDKHTLKYNDAGSRKETTYYLTELSNNLKPPVLQPKRHSCYAWATFEDACRLMRFLEQKRMLLIFRDIIHRKKLK